MGEWGKRGLEEVKSLGGLLLDLDGVFYVGKEPIAGARNCLRQLQGLELPFRFITNTTTSTPTALVSKLNSMGFNVEEDFVFTAVSATLQYLRGQGDPSCYLLLRREIKQLFCEFSIDDVNPDYVVIGDIGADWDYATLNRVFNMLMRGSSLVCMHRNKYWQGEDGLLMDIGAFVTALEYVADKRALVIGKPSMTFFQEAMGSLGMPADRVAIVGDDIDSDIGGGQAIGAMGILVHTGKYRKEYADKSPIKATCEIESIAELPGLIADCSLV